LHPISHINIPIFNLLTPNCFWQCIFHSSLFSSFTRFSGNAQNASALNQLTGLAFFSLGRVAKGCQEKNRSWVTQTKANHFPLTHPHLHRRQYHLAIDHKKTLTKKVLTQPNERFCYNNKGKEPSKLLKYTNGSTNQARYSNTKAPNEQSQYTNVFTKHRELAIPSASNNFKKTQVKNRNKTLK
jgi:hypothetical protein